MAKSLIAFSFLSCLFIVLIWIFQAIFFSTIYQSTKKSEIKNILNDSIRHFSLTQEYEEYLLHLSMESNASFLIFKEENQNVSVIFNTSRNKDQEAVITNINAVLINATGYECVGYDLPHSSDLHLHTFAQKKVINQNIYYFAVTSPITPVSTIVNNYSFLLVFISIGVLCLTMIGSYFLARQLSTPISNIAKKAKQITTTSGSKVKFNSSEYLEVQELSSTLNYALDELDKTDKIRKEVLANVSHELKTPLTMIKSYTELIQDISGNDPVKREEHLNVIYSEANRLELLLNDMLDYSKLESGIMAYDKTTFNLSLTALKFYNIYKQKYTEFTFNCDIDENCIIYADQKRIEQVITNLLNNAINYSKNNKNITIKLKKADNPNLYKLEIIDKGIGISKDNLPHIFDRHFRTTNAKRTTVGSGIGLSIVKSILNDHNFSFGVVSQENEGSNFYIYFNLSNKEGNN